MNRARDNKDLLLTRSQSQSNCRHTQNTVSSHKVGQHEFLMMMGQTVHYVQSRQREKWMGEIKRCGRTVNPRNFIRYLSESIKSFPLTLVCLGSNLYEHAVHLSKRVCGHINMMLGSYWGVVGCFSISAAFGMQPFLRQH